MILIVLLIVCFTYFFCCVKLRYGEFLFFLYRANPILSHAEKIEKNVKDFSRMLVSFCRLGAGVNEWVWVWVCSLRITQREKSTYKICATFFCPRMATAANVIATAFRINMKFSLCKWEFYCMEKKNTGEKFPTKKEMKLAVAVAYSVHAYTC